MFLLDVHGIGNRAKIWDYFVSHGMGTVSREERGLDIEV